MNRPTRTVRLSRSIFPERYRIMLKPDVVASSFIGEETLYLVVRSATDTITLHAKDLVIRDAHARYGGRYEMRADIRYNDAREEVTFHFPKKISKGNAELSLAFSGNLTDSMRGFYKSSYAHQGQEKVIATTQFEATDARRAFPCFDEPSHKAIFDITLVVPKGFTAISNTIPKSVREHEGGYRAVEFAPTPKMSTYLVACIVGEFEYIEAKTKRGVLIRVFVTPGKKSQARFALKCAVKILSFYEHYFGIHYPLPVLDLIAIPDFAAGAMENWGAVTYRETALLVDPDHSSIHTKQWVALVIAHELAHQWFGNLVTMEWWTHLWLNEGFASYIEYLAVDHLFPRWHIWRQFMNHDHDAALILDALAHTHAIEVPVSHPNEISEIFDAVSYSKGASIIRMLASYVGDGTFRRALTHYLRKHQYGNATTEDLWAALEQVSKKPVRKIMRAWTTLFGYPVLRITSTPGNKIVIEQERFFSSSISKKNSRERTVWPIPFFYLLDGKERFMFITKRRNVLSMPTGGTHWIKGNSGERGFYRIDYDDSLSVSLASPIRTKQVTLEDRLGILRDTFAVAEAGSSSVVEALELAESYRGEREYSIWLMLLGSLAQVGSLGTEEVWYEKYREYVRHMLSDIVRVVGWDKKARESHETTLLRALVLNYAGMSGNEAVGSHARLLVLSKKVIAPELRSAVYAIAVRTGGKLEYDAILRRYHIETLQEERSRLLRALALSRDARLIKRTLSLCFSKSVRSQDMPTGLVTLLQSRYARRYTWDYLKAHWDDVVSRFEGGHLLSQIIDGLSGSADEAFYRDIKGFFKGHKAPGAERTVRQVLESLESNIAWKRRDMNSIAKWLNN